MNYKSEIKKKAPNQEAQDQYIISLIPVHSGKHNLNVFP